MISKNSGCGPEVRCNPKGGVGQQGGRGPCPQEPAGHIELIPAQSVHQAWGQVYTQWLPKKIKTT